MAANDSGVSLPPRKSRCVDNVTIRRNRSSLDILRQMGFQKERAEKALVATGDKGVQIASDWLLSHVNDPELDSKTGRDYFLYLCPLGELLDQLLHFWSASFKETGFNRAHNSFPHITLCSSFKADDCSIAKLCHTLKTVVERHANKLGPAVPLEYFSSSNFFGLFVADSFMPRLKQISAEFAEEAKKIGVEIEPHRKQLHISLAYQFVSTAKDQLQTLTSRIDLNAPASWEIRLYSRDPRITNQQMRRVCYPHHARDADELELVPGDLISVKQSELEDGSYGWFVGLSHTTGCTGLFPGNYTQRAVESDAWTLHRGIPIISPKVSSEDAQNGSVVNGAVPDITEPPPGPYNYSNPTYTPNVFSTPALSQLAQTRRPSAGGGHTTAERQGSQRSPRHRPCYQTQRTETRAESGVSSSSGHQVAADIGSRQLYVVRHGERIDFTFGRDWIQNCFDQSGKYVRMDLNMPKEIPKRRGGRHSFFKDAPLTVQGHLQAKILGEALAEKEVSLSHIYSSPSLRCIETAADILKMLGSSAQINIEPGLFEWFGWYTQAMPNFMSVAELIEAGFNVNPANCPVVPQSKFNLQESVDEYYSRSCHVTTEILRRHRNEGGSVLLLAHAASLDTCTRQLVGRQPPSDFLDRVRLVSYCAVAVAQEGCGAAATWQLVEPPVLPFSHSSNTRYDCNLLMEEVLES